MILWSVLPALSAICMFFGVMVFPPRPKLRATTQAEREYVAARSRMWRTLGVASLLLLAPLVVALLHLFADPAWMPRELS